MEKQGGAWGQWIGIALLCALGLMILHANWSRESLGGSGMFLFIRWPVWVLLGLGVPFVAVRLVLWRRRRRAAAKARMDPGADAAP